MKKLFTILLGLAVALFWVNLTLAAEHPGEHPGKAVKSEHPGSPAKEHPGKAPAREHPGKAAEHPGKAAEHPGEHPGEKEMLSADEIIDGIKDHINTVTKANNGYFPLTDTQEGKDLRLKLVKVHEDKVSFIKKDDAYFACTDFVANDGTKYDVDFWMKKGEEGSLEVYQTKIHKKAGIPRFTYRDDEIVDLGPAMAPEEHT